ncbi:MAG: arylsulfatase [Verrucomicrobiales bacterium]|nr:arylsulfatase [Verrucomicrobiales bacterium]
MRRLLCLLIAGTIPLLSHGAESPPNVVIFLSDDQAWGDLSVNGNTNLKTPHIDSLARDGSSFENFYVCAVCAPTRAEFLTGRYHYKTGVSGVSEGTERINPDETTLADALKEAGYATGAFGKWHNGTQAPYHPNDRGFDEYYGFTSGHWGHYFSPPLDHNRKTVRGNGYVVDDFTDKAIDFIRENKDRPFFCYLPYNTPHSPMMIDDQFYDRFANLDPEMKYRSPEKEDIMMTRAALAMCENIDWNVGRILETLESLDLSRNTIVIYFSDNGPNSYRWNGGMKGKKGSVDEGGLRSPFMIRWPGEIEAGRTISQIAGGIDILPTLLDLTDTSPELENPLDGVSLKPLLLETNPSWDDRILFNAYRKKLSLRTQRFRLDGAGKLFDIESDRGQEHDISGQHSAVANDLKLAAQAFKEEVATFAEQNTERPFTVGFAKHTTLPARDGIPHGSIERSSKAPNNSFFENWTSESGHITWKVEVSDPATFQITLNYTCREEDLGVKIRLEDTKGSSAESTITEAFDPPLYDKSKERVEESHYYVKDFKAVSLGELTLPAGENLLTLSAADFTGNEAIDVHSIELTLSE